MQTMSPRPEKPVPAYAVAIIAVSVATLIRFALHPWLQIHVPFATFFLAVMVSAWRDGLGPGLFSALLSTGVAIYLFIPPFHAFKVDPAFMIPLMVFVIEATVITMMSDWWRRREAEVRREQLRWVSDALPVLVSYV